MHHPCALLSDVATALSLRRLRGDLSRCPVAVFGELVHHGALTRWLAPPPAHRSGVAVQSADAGRGGWCDVSGSGGMPCLAAYVLPAPWVDGAVDSYLQSVGAARATRVRAAHNGDTVTASLRGRSATLRKPASFKDAADMVAALRASPRRVPQRLVVVHLRDLKQGSCGGKLSQSPVQPCCSPTAANIVARLQELGYTQAAGYRVVLLLDGSSAMRDVALGVVKQLGGRACTMVQDAFIRKVAPATIGIEHARLLLETCVAWLRQAGRVSCSHRDLPCIPMCRRLAEVADVFIGNRFSSLSCVRLVVSCAALYWSPVHGQCILRYWVSMSRGIAGLDNVTHTMCDDLPASWIGPFPTPREPAEAIAAGSLCAALAGASLEAKRVAHEAFGCRFQVNPHSGLASGNPSLPYELPTRADVV